MPKFSFSFFKYGFWSSSFKYDKTSFMFSNKFLYMPLNDILVYGFETNIFLTKILKNLGIFLGKFIPYSSIIFL